VTLVGPRQELGGALAPRGVHAHVQRPVETEAEAASWVVDLGRADAQVQQHPGDGACRQHLAHAGEAAVVDGEAGIADGVLALGGGGHRLRVLVEGDQPALRAQAREQQARMAAAAEGAVDIGAVGIGEGSLHRLVQQHGGVDEAHGAGLTSPAC
jgi:hypothetical protein